MNHKYNITVELFAIPQSRISCSLFSVGQGSDCSYINVPILVIIDLIVPIKVVLIGSTNWDAVVCGVIIGANWDGMAIYTGHILSFSPGTTGNHIHLYPVFECPILVPTPK